MDILQKLLDLDDALSLRTLVWSY